MEITIYNRKSLHSLNDRDQTEGLDGFKLTAGAGAEDGTILITAETDEEGIESMTYSRVTPQEMIAIGHKFIEAGKMFSCACWHQVKNPHCLLHGDK